RRLEAQLAIIGSIEADIEARRSQEDRPTLIRRRDEARARLHELESEVQDPARRAEGALARPGPDLIPEFGDPEGARLASERLIDGAASPAVRSSARRLRVVALAQAGRYLDAERGLPEALADASLDDLLDLARRLDRTAALADSDVARRRVG